MNVNGVPWRLTAVGIGGWAIVLLPFVAQFVRARKSRSWPRVDATITHSDVVRNGKNFRADVRFAYTVDGARRTSDRIRVGWRWSVDKGSATAVTRRYPVGSNVKAAYDPARPDCGVLEPGVRAGLVAMLVLVGLMAVGGMAMTLFAAIVGPGTG